MKGPKVPVSPVRFVFRNLSCSHACVRCPVFGGVGVAAIGICGDWVGMMPWNGHVGNEWYGWHDSEEGSLAWSY